MHFVLGARNSSVNKTDSEFPFFPETYILVREGQKRNNN